MLGGGSLGAWDAWEGCRAGNVWVVSGRVVARVQGARGATGATGGPMELMRVGAPISPRSKCCFARLGDGPVLGNAARPHNHFRTDP